MTLRFDTLAGTHRKLVERKLQQLFSQEPVDLLEEVKYKEKLKLNETSYKELQALADSIFFSKSCLKPGTYAVKLSHYLYLYHSNNKTEILTADKFVFKLEELIEEAIKTYNDSLLSEVVFFIHNYLEYFQIGSPLLIKLYRLEALHSHLQTLKGVFSEDDKLFKMFSEKVAEELSQTLNLLEKDTTYTVRVWLLRELYYFHSSLSGMDTKADFIESYKSLFHGNEKVFRQKTEDNNINCFGCTNPDTYLNAVRTFNSARNIPKLARFNILLNLSHCNGTMATKYIKVRNKDLLPGMNSVIDFLDGLSDGLYTKDIPYLIYKETGVLPRWFV